MALNFNLVKEFVEQNNHATHNKPLCTIDNDVVFDYLKTKVQGLNHCIDNSHLLNDNTPMETIYHSARVPESNSLLIDIMFIRILTRNQTFVEKYFTSVLEDQVSLFDLFLEHYKKVITIEALKNNYLSELAKTISNTIVQTKNLSSTANFQYVMSRIESIMLPAIKWLQYMCKIDTQTSDCMYHHYRWLFLVCSYSLQAKKTLMANYDCFLTWYGKLYDFFSQCIMFEHQQTSILDSTNDNETSNQTQEHFYFCSNILFPCTNTLFNLTFTVYDHPNDFSSSLRQLSSIFYKYMVLISDLHETFTHGSKKPILYEELLVLLCNFSSCLSCVGVFDIFSLVENNPLISKLQGSSNEQTRKLQYKGGFSDTFESYNVSRVSFLVSVLQNLAISVLNSLQSSASKTGPMSHSTVIYFSGDRTGELIKFLVGMISLCKYSKRFRRYIRFQIIPPLNELKARVRPEQEQSLRGYLTRLLTTTNISLNMVAGEFLYVLCRENVSRLVKYVGMGNAMGYLHHRGLLSPTMQEDSAPADNVSSDNSEIEDYEKIAEQIDPITGAITKHHYFITKGHPQDERDLNSLMENIQKLQQLDVITTANITDDGKIVKSIYSHHRK